MSRPASQLQHRSSARMLMADPRPDSVLGGRPRPRSRQQLMSISGPDALRRNVPQLDELSDPVRPKLIEAKGNKEKAKEEYQQMLNRMAFLEEAERAATQRLTSTKKLVGAFKSKREEIIAQDENKRELEELRRKDLERKTEMAREENERKKRARREAASKLLARQNELSKFKNDLVRLKEDNKAEKEELLRQNRDLAKAQRESNRAKTRENLQERQVRLKRDRDNNRVFEEYAENVKSDAEEEIVDKRRRANQLRMNMNSSLKDKRMGLHVQNRDAAQAVVASQVKREQKEADFYHQQAKDLQDRVDTLSKRLDQARQQQLEVNEVILGNFSLPRGAASPVGFLDGNRKRRGEH